MAPHKTVTIYREAGQTRRLSASTISVQVASTSLTRVAGMGT